MSSSLDKLVDNIVGQSKARADELKKQALGEVEERLGKERAEAVRDADQIIRNARSEAQAERNRRISRAKQQARLAYLAEKNKVVRGVLEELRCMLAEFARDDSSYRPFLTRAIARGVEAIPSETVRIALPERDLKRFKSSRLLEEALAKTQTAKKAVLSNEPIEALGGAVVTSEDGRMRADCTLDAKLELMEARLLAQISKILFAS